MYVCILYVCTSLHTQCTRTPAHTHTHTHTLSLFSLSLSQVKCKDELSDLWERLVAEKERSLALAQALLQVANKMELDLPDDAGGSHTLIVHALKQALPRAHISLSLSISIFISISISISVSISLYIYIYRYIYTYLCMYVCMYV